MTPEKMAELIYETYRREVGGFNSQGVRLPRWEGVISLLDRSVQANVVAIRASAQAALDYARVLAEEKSGEKLDAHMMEEVGAAGMALLIEADCDGLNLRGEDMEKPYHDIFGLTDRLERIQNLGLDNPEAAADYAQVPDEMLAAAVSLGAGALNFARRAEAARAAEGGGAH